MNSVLPGPKPSVVLVDDSWELRALVRRRLQSSGLFEVVGEGEDGNEAISLANRWEPDLMLLDTSMPAMDGIEALPPILALSPGTKVVIFTGFEDGGLAARARELGAADFIEKSLPLDELPARLLRVVGDTRAAAPARRPQRLRVVDADDAPTAFDEEQAVVDEQLIRFRELFDRAAIGMATLTLNGTIVRANDAMAGLMSCRPHDLVGVDYGRLTRGRGEELDRGLAAILADGDDPTTFEHLLPGVPGEHVPRVVRATLAPVRDARRQVLYVLAQVQDITAQRAAESELRRSEDNLRLLVRAVGEYAIFMLDVEGNVASWNTGAQRIKGYSADEIIGRSFEVFYPPEERAEGRPARNLETARREGQLVDEGWRVRRDGTRFWASVVITPVHDDAGEHVGFAKVTRDRTAERELTAERQRATARQDHLLSVTAHELRTPAAFLAGSADLLESWDRLSADERQELAQGIRSSAHRLQRLGADLSLASRVSREGLELRVEEVSLDAVVRAAAARRRAADGVGTGAGTGVETRVEVPRDAPVRLDPQRVGQALDNLLDNAVRHGSPPVTVSAAVDGDVVRIRVADAGPGVPAELLPHLFQPFATGGFTGGTGLGLHLAREIARAHGGDVTYRPPGAGRPGGFEVTLGGAPPTP